jgi:hypothetical protein
MADPPMAEPLVYLDVDDEITSVAARIRAAEGESVTLVLPFGSRLATSRINFRLLAREATERGKRIELITADASARSLASAAGLTVHPSVAAYEGARAGTAPIDGESADGTDGARGSRAKDRPGRGPEDGQDDEGSTTGVWTASALAATAPGAADVPVGGLDIDADAPTRVITIPRKKSPAVRRVGPPRPPVRTGLAVGLGLAAIAVVIVGGLLAIQLLPSATIVLAPRAEPISPLNLQVEARTDVTAVDPVNLLIPAQLVEFDLTAQTTVTATGTKVTETKATGNVTFSNFDTGSAIVIPAGSIVQTKGKHKVQFATVADLTLPSAHIDFFPPFPTRPSTGSVGVEAVEAGEDGNVGNNTIVVVPGGDRNLFVTNSEATAGGSRSEAPEISQDDVDAALETLADALQADLDAQIASNTGVPAGVTVFPETAVLAPGAPSIDPATLVGSPELEVELTQTGAGSVVGVDPAPLETIARSRLEAEVIEGWSLDPDSVELTRVTPTPFGSGVTYPLTIAGTMVHDVDVPALVQSIRGLLAGEARTRLEAYGDVQLSLWPDWVTTIPDNTDRIDLTLAEPALAASPAP